jgi:membrane-associated phospholipid phosphatase
MTVPWSCVFGTMLLCSLYIAYRKRAPFLARLSVSGAQLVVFSRVGAVLTYAAMAASPFPLADVRLGQADAAFGFDWLAWFGYVNANPQFHVVLSLAYASIPVQGIGLILYFSHQDERRVDEFLMAAMLSIILITPIMFVLPAVGAWSQYGVGMVEPWRDDILALRSHTMIAIGEPTGIVSFPSFHTVLGVLFATMARGHGLFVPILTLNLLMIASVMSEGAHYGVDVLSGVAVAFVAFWASRFLLTRCSSKTMGVNGAVSGYTGAFRDHII